MIGTPANSMSSQPLLEAPAHTRQGTHRSEPRSAPGQQELTSRAPSRPAEGYRWREPVDPEGLPGDIADSADASNDDVRPEQLGAADRAGRPTMTLDRVRRGRWRRPLGQVTPLTSFPQFTITQ